MYIGLLLGSFIYSLYSYFKLVKNKVPFKNNVARYLLLIVCLIVLLAMLIDLPFYIGIDKETVVGINHIKVYSTGRNDSINLVTLYMDDEKKIYWSGAPIGQKEWIEYGGGLDDSNRICTIKYLPLTRIVVKVTEENQVVYNNFKDILSMSLTLFIILFGMVIVESKESIFGKKKSKYR